MGERVGVRPFADVHLVSLSSKETCDRNVSFCNQAAR